MPRRNAMQASFTAQPRGSEKRQWRMVFLAQERASRPPPGQGKMPNAPLQDHRRDVPSASRVENAHHHLQRSSLPGLQCKIVFFYGREGRVERM